MRQLHRIGVGGAAIPIRACARDAEMCEPAWRGRGTMPGKFARHRSACSAPHQLLPPGRTGGKIERILAAACRRRCEFGDQPLFSPPHSPLACSDRRATPLKTVSFREAASGNGGFPQQHRRACRGAARPRKLAFDDDDSRPCRVSRRPISDPVMPPPTIARRI